MDKTRELGSKPIGKLLASYSIPAVIAMVVNAIYNVVDRIFIGQYAGEFALAGLTVAFPLMLIVFALASLIGAGGASLLSIRLGEQDKEGANHVFGNTVSLGILVTLVTVIAILFNIEKMLTLFGATKETLSYSMNYMQIILMGFVFQMVSFVLNSSVRTEGKPVLSMIAMMTSAVTNIILDYILIGQFGMGVEGAAYATILGQFTGLAILLTHYVRGKSTLRPKLEDFFPDVKVIVQIVSIGFASFITNVGASAAMAFMNRGLGEYGGTAAITAMGAINSLYTFFIMPINGVRQGMQPIIGYNFGAKQEDRVNQTMKYGLTIGIVFSTLVFVVLQLFPETFIGFFLGEGSPTIALAVNGLRIFIAMLPLLSVNLMGIVYFQATAKGRTSMLLGMMRQFLFLIPIILILPNYYGLNGVWLATPIADAFSILITGIVLYREMKGSNSNHGMGELLNKEGSKLAVMGKNA